MPLPANDTAWPPKELATVSPKIAEWAAWWSGDHDALRSVYGRGQGARVLGHTRPSQLSGGMVGKVARWFWGQPTPTGQQSTKLHVPLAADLATGSADLLFAEQPVVTTETEDTAKRERLDLLLEAMRWESLLPEAAEVGAALTGVFLRVCWDTDVSPYPFLTQIHPDAALPEFKFGRLSAVTFWKVIQRDNSTVWRHLERHEKGRILHGLYQGTDSNIGKAVPLTESTATNSITVDAEGGITTGSDFLTAVYVPNVRPTRRWRDDPIGSNLGRSDFDSLEPEFDALDETFTSWMRDVRIGKGRIIADQTALESSGPGQGAMLDLDREVFVGLNIMGADDKAPLTPQQFEIRAADHEATIMWIMQAVVRSAGYSLQTFGLGEDGAAVTATEVSSRDRRSMTTREKKTRYWTPELVHILTALLDVDKQVFNGPGRIDGLKITFPPSVQPTQLELAQTAQALKVAQAASTETLVRMTQPDLDDIAVTEEVAKIMAENSLAIPSLDFPQTQPEGDEPSDEPPASE